MILMRDLPTLLDSFPRYAPTFLSTFIILGKWGENRWVNRLLLPVFLLLHFWLLFVSISWGWVA
jgi:hypothetical protein